MHGSKFFWKLHKNSKNPSFLFLPLCSQVFSMETIALSYCFIVPVPFILFCISRKISAGQIPNISTAESNTYAYVDLLHCQTLLLRFVPFYSPTNNVWESLTTASPTGSIIMLLNFCISVMSEVEQLYMYSSICNSLPLTCSYKFPFYILNWL